MVGQINLDSILGKYIYDIVSKKDVKTIVEIGTWNGHGSTECIKKSIIENRKEEYEVFSLEINEKMYNIALGNQYPPNFHIILGSIIEEHELNWMDWDEYFKSSKGSFHGGSKRVWFEEDKHNLRNVENVFYKIPLHIDLLILDGGEFTTYPEFLKIGRRARIIILDDTKELKCEKIRQEIISNKDYEIIEDNLIERNGFLIAQRII